MPHTLAGRRRKTNRDLDDLWTARVLVDGVALSGWISYGADRHQRWVGPERAFRLFAVIGAPGSS
jgi:hypothetical protein